MTRILAMMVMAATLLGQAGCAVLRDMDVAGQPVTPDTRLRSVYLATNRAAEPGDPLLLFRKGAGRGHAPALRFGRVDVSVPPGHRPGRMEWALQGQLDPRVHFAARQVVRYPQPAGFYADLRRDTPPGAPVTVFVHGFNVAGAESVMRGAQLATDAQAQGPMIAFSWPSAMRTLGYGADRDRALASRDALQDLLIGLAQGDAPIVLVAHSMGALLVMETLRQMALTGQGQALSRVHSVVLISPDLAPGQFAAQARQITPFPHQMLLVVSGRDQMLRLAGLLTRRQVLGATPDAPALSGLGVQVVDLTDDAPGWGLRSHIAGMAAPRALEALRQTLN